MRLLVVGHSALKRFLDGMPARFDTATGNPHLNAVIVTADPTTGVASGIERVDLSADDVEAACAALMAQQSAEPLATLRQNVTSPGGTTEAAINTMLEHGIPAIIASALQAAQQRSVELAQEFGEP